MSTTSINLSKKEKIFFSPVTFQYPHPFYRRINQTTSVLRIFQRPTNKNPLTTKEYNTCVNQLSDDVYRFLLKQLSNEMEAQDIVQNTFEKLWINREQVVFEKAKSYLFTVAYRNMIDFTRRQKFRGSNENIQEKGDNSFQHQFETRELLNKGLEQLSEIQKTLILMRDYEGYNYEELADMTDLTLSQVKVYLYRGRKKLQAYIKQMDQAV